MGRDDGFAVADVSSGHFDDAKIRKLWRLVEPSIPDMCEAMTLHMAAVLGSWRSGRRVDLEDAVPLWLPIRADLVSALVSAGLLDGKHRIPARSWTDWYGTASARREARRESGRLGGLAKAKRAGSDAKATLYPSGRQAGPSAPSDPDRPPRAGRSPKGGAPRGGKAKTPEEIMREEGGFAARLVEGGNR